MASKGTCTSFLLVPVLTWQQGHQMFNQPKCQLEINVQQYFRWDQTVIHVLNVCCVQIGQLFLFLSVCPWTRCFKEKKTRLTNVPPKFFSNRNMVYFAPFSLVAKIFPGRISRGALTKQNAKRGLFQFFD